MIDWAHLNGVDWVIIAVLAVSTLLSLWRGFTREALSLAGWIAALVVANVFADALASALSGAISNITGRYVAAYVILFVGTLVAFTVIVHLAAQVVRVAGLTVLDRLLGTVFGFARGVILVLFVVFVLQQLLQPRDLQWLHQSQLMPHLDMLAQWVRELFTRLDAGQWVAT